MHGISDYTITVSPATDQAGKRYAAELHFTSGFLDGLKLTGVTVWQAGGKYRVCFPPHLSPTARQCEQPIRWASAPDMLTNAVLRAVALHELHDAAEALTA